MKTIHCTAPGRCGLIGNPTDMYGGSVISCSIPFRASVTIEPADHLEAQVDGLTRAFEGPDDLQLNGDHFDICRAILDYFHDD